MNNTKTIEKIDKQIERLEKKIDSISGIYLTNTHEYGCLVGRVYNIIPVGSPLHDTANDTDDVYINFFECEYSENRKVEISETFTMLYNEKTVFEDCPIDDVIMAPCCLIRISSIDEDSLKSILESGYNAACYCYNELSRLTDHNHAGSALAIKDDFGEAVSNKDMSVFTITRIIGGKTYYIELSEHELLNAYNRQDKKYYLIDINTILDEMEADGKLSGYTVDMIRSNAELMQKIADIYEEKVEEYDKSFRRAATEAITESLKI